MPQHPLKLLRVDLSATPRVEALPPDTRSIARGTPVDKRLSAAYPPRHRAISGLAYKGNPQARNETRHLVGPVQMCTVVHEFFGEPEAYVQNAHLSLGLTIQCRPDLQTARGSDPSDPRYAPQHPAREVSEAQVAAHRCALVARRPFDARPH